MRKFLPVFLNAPIDLSSAYVNFVRIDPSSAYEKLNFVPIDPSSAYMILNLSQRYLKL